MLALWWLRDRAAARARAFCGFYVGKADSTFNNASQVVLVHQGNQTVMSLMNDYQGAPRSSRWSSRCRKCCSAARFISAIPRCEARRITVAPRLVEY